MAETSKISKIKLGNKIYDIKDALIRTAVATSSLVNKTNSNYNNGVGSISHIVFYEDSNKTTVYHEIPIPSLTVGQIAALEGILAPIVSTNLLLIDEAGNNPTIVDSTGITVKMANNKPVISFNSTTDGTTSGTATEVILPVGANGTIALTSDISSAGENKVGYGDKTTINPSGQHSYDLINLYTSNGGTSLSTIPLSTLNTQTLNVDEVNATSVDATTVEATRVDTTLLHLGGPLGSNPDPDENLITIGTEGNVTNFYFMSGPSGSTKTIKLPMTTDEGTIALTSDVGAVLSDVDDIKTLLNIEGTNVQGTIDAYSDIVTFLDGLAESPDLATQLASKISDVQYDTTGTKPKFKYQKIGSGSWTNITDVETTAISGNLKPITSGGVYTAINTLENSVVKKIELNDKELSPENGIVSLSNIVTKIQLNGKDQTLTPNSSTGEGKINLTNIVTNVTLNNTPGQTSIDTTNGTYTVALTETDPVFSASPAAGITSTLINNWDSMSGGIKDVRYTTDTPSGSYTRHILQKKIAGSSNFTSYVELPTAIYTDNTETLELILAKTPA